MLELVFNSLWIMLALAAIHGWRQQPADHRIRVGHVPTFVALLCALLLLFPSVSISDDLHPADQAMEDCTKRTLKGAPSVTHKVAVADHALAANVIGQLCQPRFSVVDRLLLTAHHLATDAVLPAILGRAPPAPALG